MTMETKVKISCEHCSAFLSVPRNYSGKIACVKCRNEMTVNSPSWMPPSTEMITATAIRDVDLIAHKLDSIEEAVRGVGSAIWMVFFFIPLIFTVFWVIFFINIF